MNLHDNTTYPPHPPNCHVVTCVVPPPPTPITGADIQSPALFMGAALVIGLAATGIARWASHSKEER